MSDPLRPEGSVAWTQVSRPRARFLMRTPGYDVQFKRFVGGKGWQDLKLATKHEMRTSYRARKVSSP